MITLLQFFYALNFAKSDLHRAKEKLGSKNLLRFKARKSAEKFLNVRTGRGLVLSCLVEW